MTNILTVALDLLTQKQNFLAPIGPSSVACCSYVNDTAVTFRLFQTL